MTRHFDTSDHPSRQPALRPAELDDAQRQLYDAITGGPRSGGAFRLTDADGVLQGPFGGFLLSPAIGDALQQLGAAIRYRSRLTPRVRELAILVVAAHHGSAFERYAHRAVGKSVGLSETEMDAVESGDALCSADSLENAVVQLTRSILEGLVDDDTWSACVPPLQLDLVFELIVLVGYYTTLATQMRVLRTDQLPD
jgi:4-carboxymuconolactone decarboxylase